MLTLTVRQKEVLDCITCRLRETGKSPTVREIGDGVGLPHPNAVMDHISALLKKGYLVKDGSPQRNLRPADETFSAVALGSLVHVSVPRGGMDPMQARRLAAQLLEVAVEAERCQ